MTVLRRPLASEEGFGLVELLIAMTVMAVGISAIVAGFTAGIFALNRASIIATAGTLADKQMEFYRGLPYTKIAVGAAGLGTTYTTDAALAGGTQTGNYDITACASPSCVLGSSSTEAQYCSNGSTPVPPSFPAPCTAVQSTVTGPDGRSYRVDTYITWYCALGTLQPPNNPPGGSVTFGSTTYTTGTPGCTDAGGTVQSRPVKQVTVVVRDGTTVSKTYYRETSTFDQAT
jgi:prepilin-type N-terminal cleavage/methylation domain-containing protein